MTQPAVTDDNLRCRHCNQPVSLGNGELQHLGRGTWCDDGANLYDTMAGIAVPDLEFRLPDCSVCDGGEVAGDDTNFWCETCGCTWWLDGTGGER